MCGHPTMSKTEKLQKKKHIAEPVQTWDTLVQRQSETQASGGTAKPSKGAQVYPSHVGKGAFRDGHFISGDRESRGAGVDSGTLKVLLPLENP